jgi:hypothetical protein
LRLIVKTYAFCAFVRNDVIIFIGYGRVSIVRITIVAAFRSDHARNVGLVRESPFLSMFVDRAIRTFWLARGAIDAIVCDNYCHNLLVYYFQEGFESSKELGCIPPVGE